MSTYKMLAGKPSSTMYMAEDKLQQALKEKWWFYIDDKDEVWPNLNMIEKRLPRIEFVHDRFQSVNKKPNEAQIETNCSEKHRNSVLV